MISKLPINKLILNHWGNNEPETMIVAIEELGELQKELLKLFRGKADRAKIVEELTDVIIMCQALQYIHQIDDIEILSESVMKQARTIERIKNNTL